MRSSGESLDAMIVDGPRLLMLTASSSETGCPSNISAARLCSGDKSFTWYSMGIPQFHFLNIRRSGGATAPMGPLGDPIVTYVRSVASILVTPALTFHI